MPQSVTEIIAIMDAQVTEETSLTEINNTSTTSRFRVLKYIVAKAIETLEQLFDAHKIAVNNTIDNERYGRIGWYEAMGLKYQHGRQLVLGKDYYDNSSITEQDVVEEQIIKFCSITELDDGRLSAKLASGTIGNIIQLTPEQLAGAQVYFNKIRIPGVRVLCSSNIPDMLKLSLSIEFDGLILDSDGKRLDGTNDNPVLDAINNYLASMKFNAEYINMHLIDAIQNVAGVKVVDLVFAQAKYSEYPYSIITSRYSPNSGYLALDLDSIDLINYMPYV